MDKRGWLLCAMMATGLVLAATVTSRRWEEAKRHGTSYAMILAGAHDPVPDLRSVVMPGSKDTAGIVLIGSDEGFILRFARPWRRLPGCLYQIETEPFRLPDTDPVISTFPDKVVFCRFRAGTRISYLCRGLPGSKVPVCDNCVEDIMKMSPDKGLTVKTQWEDYQ